MAAIHNLCKSIGRKCISIFRCYNSSNRHRSLSNVTFFITVFFLLSDPKTLYKIKVVARTVSGFALNSSIVQCSTNLTQHASLSGSLRVPLFRFGIFYFASGSFISPRALLLRFGLFHFALKPRTQFALNNRQTISPKNHTIDIFEILATWKCYRCFAAPSLKNDRHLYTVAHEEKTC